MAIPDEQRPWGSLSCSECTGEVIDVARLCLLLPQEVRIWYEHLDIIAKIEREDHVKQLKPGDNRDKLDSQLLNLLTIVEFAKHRSLIIPGAYNKLLITLNTGFCVTMVSLFMCWT